jgi:transcriptional regulator with XRE-family HTH domain
MSSSSRTDAASLALGGQLGAAIRDERRRRRWTLRVLGERSGLAPSHPAWMEAGNVASKGRAVVSRNGAAIA